MSSVRAPRPMVVKKLMAKRVSLGLSRGKRPAKLRWRLGSFRRSNSRFKPMYWESSRNSSLMKMRLEEVVSRSLRRITSMAVQGMPSLKKRCAKSLASWRSLLVSRRWTVLYCRQGMRAKNRMLQQGAM